MSLASNPQFPGRVAIQQRVLPFYRAPFFDLLADSCKGGLSLFAGQALSVENIPPADSLESAYYYPARNLHFRDPSSKFYLCWQEGLVEWLEETDPDVLILEANPRYLSNRLAVRWMKARGRPVLGWGLGAPTLGGIFAPIRRWNRVSYLHSLDGLIAYSHIGAAEYQALGIPEDRIYVATNSAMRRPIGPAPTRPNKIDESAIVMFVGRLQKRKRLDILFQACAALSKELRPKVFIVGDGPAREEFENIAEKIYPQAEFLGAKFGAEAKPFFEMADLFALPGTGGLAVQQAMSFALPVIVAKGDGTQDDLVRPENGWQVMPGDQLDFNHALAEALSDIPGLRKMGLESFRIVSEEINLEAMVDAFIQAMIRVTSGKAR